MTNQLPPAIWCDLDNTLANLNGRNPYDNTGSCSGDAVNEPVRELLWRFANDYAIIICSGREATAANLAATKLWLNNNNIPYNELMMREEKNYEPDSSLKSRFLDIILSKYDLFFACDDRPQVVKMLRSRGIWLFECNQSMEDF